MRFRSMYGPKGVVQHVLYYSGLLLLVSPSFLHAGMFRETMTAVDVAVVVGVVVALSTRRGAC